MKYESATRIPSLDGVRAISVMLVIDGHLWGGLGGPGFTAALAVHVFFVLSGYLITRLLQQEHDRVGRIDLFCFLPAAVLSHFSGGLHVHTGYCSARAGTEARAAIRGHVHGLLSRFHHTDPSRSMR